MVIPDTAAQTLLTNLTTDHQSGATQLALRTLKDLAGYLSEIKPSEDALSGLLAELKGARPSMVVIGNAIQRVETRLRAGSDTAPAVVLAVHQELEDAGNRLVQHARDQIPEGAVLMTHSASSLVLRLFRRLVAERVPYSVICTQSGPGHEGHGLAASLNELEVPVTLISDAQMALFVGKADLVLTGCDSWLADGHFVNKSGTRLLALAAKERAVPFWVLADTFRDSPDRSDSVQLEELPGAELKAPEGRWITPRNIYFETIPDRLITARVTEQGVFLCPAEPRP